MKENKVLKINGTMLNKAQLENHLQKIASSHNLNRKSERSTYPIPHMLESYEIIQKTYNLLNEHLKLGIAIHPAGEWLLDNLYIIEETVKVIKRELTLKKYTNFVGIANGQYKGFARIYVLAAEIVAYTDCKIEKNDIEAYLASYQTKKTLSMDEIWNIGLFMQLAIIEHIREICEKIVSSQIQKYKAESIVERLLENKTKTEQKFKSQANKKIEKIIFEDMRYPFIEYMSYILKRYGKKGYSYSNALEETIEMLGTTVSDVIKKEHFEIATRKVLMGNSITSIKTIQRINFLEIFEKINGVEEILKQDPSDVYTKMDVKTKDYYRTKIKEISKKTKVSELYIARKILELAKKSDTGTKKSHIGYYLIDKGINETYSILNYKKREIEEKDKTKIYIFSIAILSIIISSIISSILNIKNIAIFIISFLIFLIPSTEIAIRIIQYILSKTIKPKLIPKIDLSSGINEENSTMVVIPTILKSKDKVKELMEKLEVFYIANKSKNIYFTLLGDCSESLKKEEDFDKEVIEEGKKQVKILNEKYKSEIPIFNFIYRNRTWNEKEDSYLGWERKRGLLNQFNEYLLGNEANKFRVNTIEELRNSKTENDDTKNIDMYKKIKYIITLDADTDLVLNTAFELIGAMAHILNKPIIDKQKNVVIDGYGIMQPRVGINLDISYKTIFTKIFAGDGGIDSYTNAISDTYQDNFKEGIFTGKGIYDLRVFSKVLKNAIPENTVLSHDLLEGNYLRCGLVSDIMIMDGYPTKYNSFMTRLARWIRGDWQITDWLKKYVYVKDNRQEGINKVKNPLNLLSKYKIFDNLRRSLVEISILVSMLYVNIISIIKNVKIYPIILILTIISILPYILEISNYLIFRKEGEQKQKTFAPKVSGLKGAILRAIITFANLPYKAYVSLKSIAKTIYRKKITHKNLLEWTTSEEAEKQAKSSLSSYYNQMFINVLIGLVTIGISLLKQNIFGILIGILWIIAPTIMCYISKEKEEKMAIEKLNKLEKEYILEIGQRTWKYFETYLNEENNYLIPDNYQEGRKEKIVQRTSSTNIGLSMLAVISAYDLKYIPKEKAIDLLNKIIQTVESLPKWNGHLYNWYDTKTKVPLIPRYISTVDSGNFIGYLYIVKSFILETQTKDDTSLIIIDNLINNTDFSLLYDSEKQIFSIGFNIEENKLTDSYYDLLASEARQASLVAIAKKDIPVKHWNNLSRTLTVLDKYKGLISWSGTAFEYLMPNINIPKYKGSLLDESCNFMIMSQMKYAKKLNIPWGFSEAAFNLKDLHSNYQYKAFGIPWLGLKRGLADEQVVASYGSILAINDYPKEVIQNLKLLEQNNMYDKYGFYESIDYTPERVEKGEKASVVKTYMAHHQGLILLSINNLINKNILQKRLVKNPEIEAVTILLQETMPDKFIITKENKEKVEKLKYKDYENYIVNTYNKIDERIIRGNVIANENYTVAINQKGEGVSKYKGIYINRFKKTDDYLQGIIFNFKNIKTKNIWSSCYLQNESKENYQISFMPDRNEQEIMNGNIKTKIKTTIAPTEAIELRKVILENTGNEEEIIEITSYFEPTLSRKEQDYAHPAFNKLFLVYEYDENTNSIIVKHKTRNKEEKDIYLAVNLSTNSETIGDLEYEIEEEKFLGRGNLGIPNMVKNSIPLSKKIGLVTESIVALKRTVKIKPQEKVTLDLILSVGEEKSEIIKNVEKYKINENSDKAFELSKARVEAESRYLRIKGKDIENYQKIASYIVFDNPVRENKIQKYSKKQFSQSELWKYGISGDFPIILVKIKNVNETYVIDEVLKAYEFLKIKNILTEVVILDEEKHSYENYVREEIENSILNSQMSYLKNIRTGIFSLNKGEISKEDIELLEFVSTIIIDSSKGGLENSLKEMEEEYLEKYKEIGNEESKIYFEEELNDDINILENKEELKYYNEYGAFSSDGKEYLIKVDKQNRLPTVWSHIMANKKFGTIVTENMGGYSWYKNSKLNRVTTWENKPGLDIPSEIIYIKDDVNKKVWSLGLNPMPDDRNYNIIYGFGYCKYIHKSDGIEQELEIFVPKEDSAKIGILNLKNNTPNRKKLKIYYYIKPVIGEDEIKTDTNISLTFNSNNNIICAKNLYLNDEQKKYIYVSSSQKIQSYTGDKKFFLGDGGLSNPDGIKKLSLNNNDSLGKKSCIAYEIEVEIESFSNKEISIILGAEEHIIDCKNIAYKYSKVQNCRQELEKIKNYWKETLNKLQVYTPLESTNILLNGWVLYQTLESRLLGRSGYYQSGGAYGFRDQLQDTLALKYINPEIMRNQIIKHSKHQFIEGDVEHWWHDENNRGIRTRFSDDLLWLPYLTLEYIDFTGDGTILDIETPYLKGEILKQNVDERYDKYLSSEEKGTIYEHCIKAIEKSLNFGENGLPKIGSGDWNDGFSTVGNKGKGESIWLGFFLYNILDRFTKICEDKGNIEKVEKYEEIKINLKKALNTNGWDGRWYKRAYMDDGKVLGSMQNDECRIDSISQSWSIISKAGDNDKKYISMESLENHLIDKENGIIKLLDPPFEKGNLEPGYIKAYLPGVRENGGQYTHAAIWVIIAEAMLGFGDKALELYRMINPIEHARTKDASNKYKVEPYAISADIYGANNLAGRGGWTWYTGSSSWYYKAGIEYILGLRIEKDYMKIQPCIPKDWKGYEIKYKWKNTLYNIKVENNNKNTEVSKVYLDGVEVENNIKLEDRNTVHNVRVVM